jgi:hypothetical protein
MSQLQNQSVIYYKYLIGSIAHCKTALKITNSLPFLKLLSLLGFFKLRLTILLL